MLGLFLFYDYWFGLFDFELGFCLLLTLCFGLGLFVVALVVLFMLFVFVLCYFRFVVG